MAADPLRERDLLLVAAAEELYFLMHPRSVNVELSYEPFRQASFFSPLEKSKAPKPAEACERDVRRYMEPGNKAVSSILCEVAEPEFDRIPWR